MRQRLLRVPDVAKVEIFGAQAEKVFVEISQKRLAQLGLDMNQVLAQIGAQNAVEGAGVLNAGTENLQVRVAGAVQLGRRAAAACRSAPSTRPPAWPARCAWATSPRSGAATSTRPR